MCMTDAGTTQNNFILPALPVGGLPISQDWLDRMKLVRDRISPVILNILADTMFKISIGHTNLGREATPVPNKKIISLLAKFKQTRIRIAIPIKGCSSFIDCKAWRHESESVKTMYLDATEILISSSDYPDFSGKYGC